MSVRNLLFSLLLLCASASGGEWSLISEQSQPSAQIRVWQRSLPHPPYREHRAELVSKGQPAQFINLLLDTDRIPLWVAHAEGASILESIDNNRHRVHTRFNPPFPLSRRDLVTQSEYWQTFASQTVYLVAESVPNALPRQPGYLRMNYSKACWEAEPLTGGQTRIRYQGYTDPGGAIPHWLMDMVSAEALEETLTRLAAQLAQQQADLSEIAIPAYHLHDRSYCRVMQSWP